MCAQAVLTPEDDEENFSMLEAFHLAQEIDSTLSLKQVMETNNTPSSHSVLHIVFNSLYFLIMVSVSYVMTLN